ncbi:MAG TPA: hypothetical protein VGK49_05890 [Ilumatobacteraceae bacterium]
MGLFRRRPPTIADGPNPIEQLRNELAELQVRVDAADAAKADLDGRVRAIDDRLATPITTAPPPPPEPVRTVDPAQLDMLNARVARLVERLDAVDVRITTVTTELANQLAELGNDIDSLSKASHDVDAGDVAVEMSQELEIALESLRESQTRLANEQARYQIAFRNDLAELAERLRRPTA